MKSVTASEARKNWFRILDEVANGEIVVVRRNEKRIILSLEKRKKKAIPNYKGLIGGNDLDNADKWSWDWTPAKGLIPTTHK
jgi:prevent-host-death family protein